MSCPYCAPKSRISTRSLSGRDIVGHRRFFFVRELGEEFVQRRFIVNVAVRYEALDLNLNFVTVIYELDFPALAWDDGHDHQRVVALASKRIMDLRFIETAE